MDEKVRNITLHIYIITITTAFAKSCTFQWRFLAFAFARPFTSFFWVTPTANNFATYSRSLQNYNPLDQKSTIFFLIHLIKNPPFSSWCQPHAFRSGRLCCAIRDCLQQLAWYIAHFVSWRKPSCVGRMASSDLPFVTNNTFRQSSMDSRRLDWSYKRVTDSFNSRE